jgi:uncharacterized lipoprotein YddW (UPF0748 family)
MCVWHIQRIGIDELLRRIKAVDILDREAAANVTAVIVCAWPRAAAQATGSP